MRQLGALEAGGGQQLGRAVQRRHTLHVSLVRLAYPPNFSSEGDDRMFSMYLHSVSTPVCTFSSLVARVCDEAGRYAAVLHQLLVQNCLIFSRICSGQRVTADDGTLVDAADGQVGGHLQLCARGAGGGVAPSAAAASAAAPASRRPAPYGPGLLSAARDRLEADCCCCFLSYRARAAAPANAASSKSGAAARPARCRAGPEPRAPPLYPKVTRQTVARDPPS